MNHDGLSVPDHRALLAIEKKAWAALEQCGHLRRNSQRCDDRCRFGLIENFLEIALLAAKQAATRYYKLKELERFKFGG